MNKLKLHPCIIAMLLLCVSCQGQKKTNVTKWTDITAASRGWDLYILEDSLTMIGDGRLPYTLLKGIGIGSGIVFPDFNCGTWRDTIYYSEWIILDTIGTRLIKDKRDWVYNLEEEFLGDINNLFLAVYSPCGYGGSFDWYQYRICRLTGIHERRIRTKLWIYTPPPVKPKTEYQIVVDSLKSPK